MSKTKIEITFDDEGVGIKADCTQVQMLMGVLALLHSIDKRQKENFEEKTTDDVYTTILNLLNVVQSKIKTEKTED